MGRERSCEWRTHRDLDDDEEFDYQPPEVSDLPKNRHANETKNSQGRAPSKKRRADGIKDHRRSTPKRRKSSTIWEPVGVNTGGKVFSDFVDLTKED